VVGFELRRERSAAWDGRTAKQEGDAMNNEVEDTEVYNVVINHEEQYSIWPVRKENPLGWRDGGFSGSKAECLAYIGRVWIDMRPLSVRNRAGAGGASAVRGALGPPESNPRS
jgi:MbtH protein